MYDHTRARISFFGDSTLCVRAESKNSSSKSAIPHLNTFHFNCPAHDYIQKGGVVEDMVKQVQKALRREAVLYEAETRRRLDPILKGKVVDHYFCRAVGHGKATPRPESTGARLESAM